MPWIADRNIGETNGHSKTNSGWPLVFLGNAALAQYRAARILLPTSMPVVFSYSFRFLERTHSLRRHKFKRNCQFIPLTGPAHGLESAHVGRDAATNNGARERFCGTLSLQLPEPGCPSR
jgi:hypothetical protein